MSGYGIERRVELLAHRVSPYPTELRERLFSMFVPQAFTAEALGFLHRDMGEHLAGVALDVIRLGNWRAEGITGIAVHAPTLFHSRPCGGRDGVFMEVGEGAIIAERCGARVICELRPSDVAAGGQGAPLSAYVDYILFRDEVLGRAIQNVGGIANVTFLKPGAELDDVLSFDTGPGNMVIDGVVGRITGGTSLYDEDGIRGARGTVSRELLGWLTAQDYVTQPLPKTAGREEFGQQLVDAILERARVMDIGSDDVVATVTAFTAECIGIHYRRELLPRGRLDEMVVYGGGAHNSTLMRMIREQLPQVQVRLHGEVGVPGDAREAVTWAILADETLAGNAGNVPAASGARHRVVLGKVVDPRPRPRA
jgi:anhydro-N-acetylmuramic acid kinase